MGRDVTKRNIAHVGLMAPTLDAAYEFVSNPGLRDAMASAGVANAPDIRLVVVG